MRIGVFGGAFNPVHNGHINLAECYMKELQLDKIVFIPTAVPPHKAYQNFASEQDRMHMLSSAIEGKNCFEMSDIEFKRKGKSYTYDTILQLKKIYPDDDLFLIIGADQFFSFNEWYKFRELLNEVTLCTAARNGEDEKQRLCDFKNQNDYLKNCIVSSFPVIVVSSSQIRNMVKMGEDISALVPKKVNDYIKDKKLYV